MMFGHQSAVHNHLSSKRPLFSHRMVNGTVYTEVVEPMQDEQMRLGDPPTEREEPIRTKSNS